jgi:hypothetical protein
VLTPPESVLRIPEWALTMPGTPAHDPGIGAQDRPDSPLTMVRNTHKAHSLLRVPEILTIPIPEILATPT